MPNRWLGKHGPWIIPIALVAWTGFEAYRAYLDHWEGSLRAPLILGSLAGIAFIVIGTTVVALQDRARKDARPGG